MTTEIESFGVKLREYRKEHLLTQQKMAELLGVSANHIGVLERNVKKPRASTEAAFARLSGQWINRRTDPEVKLTAAESEIYERLWQQLCRIDSEQRSEVMRVFLQLLEWTKS